MPPAPASPRARKSARAAQGPRILEALLKGRTFDEIAVSERLSPARLERKLRDELHRRWIAPAQDYARLQIARLERVSNQLARKAQKGDLAAIDRLLRVQDRLDRYHGFSKLTPVVPPYDENARQRLLDKLDRAAARLLPPPPQPE